MSDKSYLQALQEAAFWSEYHRKRKDNPHTVTAEQVGADVLGESLAGHLADVSNPHGVTAEQVGAATPLRPLAIVNPARSDGATGARRRRVRVSSALDRADTTTITGLCGHRQMVGGVLGRTANLRDPRNSTSVLIIDPVARRPTPRRSPG